MINRIVHIFRDSSGSFEGQEHGEDVVLLLRKHPVIAYARISVSLIGLLIPVFIALIFYSAIFKTHLWPLFIFLACLWFLIFWLLMFYSLTIYTLNVVIITDRRIMENEQKGIFNRKVSELHMSRIQDISVHVRGILETFLKFGNLVVQTAAHESQFTFYEIPQPEKVKNTIMKIVTDKHRGDHHL